MTRAESGPGRNSSHGNPQEPPAVTKEDLPKHIWASLTHNQKQLDEYPEESWLLSAFPSEKGQPFNQDNLVTVNDSSFREDPRFLTALSEASSRWSEYERRIDWRLHVFLWAAETALQLHSGKNFLELGTGRGFMAAGFLANRDIDHLPRRFFLADKFNKSEQERLQNLDGLPMYSEDAGEVESYFRNFPVARVISGLLPDSLREIDLGELSFVHVDLNDGKVEFDTLCQIQGNLVQNAVILFDDSGNPGMEDSLTWHRKFAEQSESSLLQLPTGQSLLVWGGRDRRTA